MRTLGSEVVCDLYQIQYFVQVGQNVVKIDFRENHLANPLMLFLKTLGIVLRYLILPVPVPFLCWIFFDHPSE